MLSPFWFTPHDRIGLKNELCDRAFFQEPVRRVRSLTSFLVRENFLSVPVYVMVEDTMKIWPTRDNIKFPDSVDGLVAQSAAEAVMSFVWFLAIVACVIGGLGVHPAFWLVGLITIGLFIRQVHLVMIYDEELREANQPSHETDQQVLMEKKK